MNGFSEEQIAELLAQGWIKGTDCGYPNHEGFIRDYRTPSPHGHYSLTPAKRGQLCLARIENGVCDTKRYFWFSQVIERFSPVSQH